ncbi:hypothetical protein OC834_006899 [Tilletia horrida]|uniref:Uncharacterized protein n=1 Tax=Tilletia horrida TaxID=155126 RepID=A0AAN6JGS6_9BASI|nr:hypothetical protein OC842_007570 [Tilletia horrida]KAK0520788.1 hypothetical protein OC834_006899 [Tilletia horrida]KAK0523686.1 hypothetical protein OC835_006182 [Tilletia horrida]
MWQVSSSRSLLRQSALSSSSTAAPAAVSQQAQAKTKTFSTSASQRRNLPARRPLDPLDTAPNAVRHRLQTGETFIVRPAPSAPTLRNAGVPSAVSQDTAPTGPADITRALFPGFSGAARANPAIAPAPTQILPPPLKPNCRTAPASSTATLTPAQIQELRELRLSTAATAAPGSKHSVRGLAARFGVSPAFVRIAAPLPRTLRNAKLAEAEERSGRDFWGFKKRLARFERRVRRELW